METAPHSESFWQTFRSLPATFAHPSRIVHACNAAITVEGATRLLEEERFRDRLSAILIEHYALSDDTGDHSSATSRLASASSAELLSLVRQFGAVYWARAIVGTIESKAVAALKQMIGEDAYAAALAHRELAGAEPARPAGDEFDAVITSAGFRCLAAWCALQPVGFAQRIRLKLPASADLDGPTVPPFNELGPPIVERIAL